ncbi:MAG: NAD(P)/FAD-dependent oxidoreductase [Nitrospinae bacterium]|nr:NAD(P)/FAD-dependent oxidoreductase [Nitrospinota bacterium]
MNKVAIIGGGASGLMAAGTAASSGCEADLFEQNDRVGKKILATGNGRCNITNTGLSFSAYSGRHPGFAAYGLKEFGFEQFERFCRSIGLLLDVKDDGRVYPLSNDARSVAAAFESFALDSGARIHTGHPVTDIKKSGGLFELSSNEKQFKGYQKLLIATGSEAAPQLGGNDSGYRFAVNFGHGVEATYPSLVQLHVDSSFHHKMAGTKINGETTLYLDRRSAAKAGGDILFTSYGVSGFSILDISQRASSALKASGHVSIGLNLLPGFNGQSLAAQIARFAKDMPGRSINTLLTGLITIKVAPHLLKDAGVDPDIKGGQITPKIIRKIAHKLQDWRFEITDTHGFKHAEVSGGGVGTAQINEKTMESTLVSGLYFSGEVIDIVGKRGGYNLHFAWASGRLAGKGLAESQF